MRCALVFNGTSHLEFQDIRANVVRIPEVAARIREAQEVWDQVSPTSLDLCNFIASDDTTFLGHIKLKSLATAIVQIGLLDRYLKRNSAPDLYIGATNGDSPLKVAIGEQTLKELVLSSSSLNPSSRRQIESSAQALPVLTGIELAQFGAFARADSDESGYGPIKSKERELEVLIGEATTKHAIDQVVVVGPGSTVFGRQLANQTGRNLTIVESIELDAGLSWFWATASDELIAVAN